MKEAKRNLDALRRGHKSPVLLSPNPRRGRSKRLSSLASPLPDSDSANALRARTPALRPHPARGLTWSSLRGKRVAWRVARARGLGECRVPPLLITPLPRQPSSPPACSPHAPSQGERPAANPGSLHLASALQRGRCSASTRGGGRWGRIYLLGLGRGAPVRGTVGPSSLAPNRFWPADSGPTGWLLVANVIWGRLGGPPTPSKIDPGWTATATNQGRRRGGPRLSRPLSFAARGEAGRRGTPGAGDGNPERAVPAARRSRGSLRPSATGPGARCLAIAAPCHRPPAGPPLPGPPSPPRGVRTSARLLCYPRASRRLWPSGRRETPVGLARSVLGEDRPYLLFGHSSSPAARSPRASARSRLLSRGLSPEGTGLIKSRP